MEDIITKKIGAIRFGVISPENIKQMSKIQVITPELYDTDGYPVDRGLMDPNMGVIDPGLRCKTCGGGLRTCPGHFGSIVLARPVLHISYLKQIKQFLSSFCFKCGKILLSQADLQKNAIELKAIKKEKDITKILAHQNKIIKKLTAKKICPYCAVAQPKIKLERPYFLKEESGQRLWSNEIIERLSKITDSDLRAIGCDPELIRPEWLVLTKLLVPPITIRPSITLESGDRSEDDLTHKLSDIVRVNQRLNENITAGAPEAIIEDLWDLLQYHITTYFDNKVAQVPPARHRTNRPLRTLKQRISGKSGRFRNNLAGKRVNFCGRSVISPDLNLNIIELGVPKEIAKEITVPETVTDWNKKWIIKLIKNSPEYPSANYIESPDGKRRKITDQTKDALLEELENGWKIERHMMDGDPVILNRQPSLHRMSMLCHITKIVPGKTFRINPAVCPPYNADFDGDEMNLHVPQTEEARAEANNLLRIDRNITSPRYGLSIIGETKDILFGLYQLTKNLNSINKKQAGDLLTQTKFDVTLPTSKTKTYTGKQIVSAILPKNCNYETSDIKIKAGKLISGTLTKKYIGAEGGLLIHHIKQAYGHKRSMQFMNELQQLALAVNRMFPYSFSFKELDNSATTDKKIKNLIAATQNKAKKIISNYKSGKIIGSPGKTAKETMEIMVLEVLNSGRNEIGQLLEKENVEDDNLMVMIRSKTGGKILNLSQISGSVGQQALRGNRIDFGYDERVLPHFKKGDLGPLAKGFIENNYKTGLNPLEFYFNSIVGRDAYIDTGMRTPKSGYLQRRLINTLQDIKSHYDGTVRDSGERIVQFKYSGDNIDVSKSDHGSVDINLDSTNIKKSLNDCAWISKENPEYIKNIISKFSKAKKLSADKIKNISKLTNQKYQNMQIDPGEAVGIVAAESLGEPGTQMTMRTFHHVGVAELNVTLGLPRLIEILDLRRKPTTPTMSVALKEPFNKNKKAAEELANKIREVKLDQVVSEFTINLAKSAIEAKLDRASLNEINLEDDKLKTMIKKAMVGAIVDKKSDKFILTFKDAEFKTLKNKKEKLKQIAVSGIPGISDVLPVKNGDEYIIHTFGTNLKKIRNYEEIDATRTTSNDIVEVEKVLGIEAARKAIINELLNVLDKQGLDVDKRHIILIADVMCKSGKVKGVTRHGVTKGKSSVLARASFEIPMQHLVDASMIGEIDELNSVVENVMLNQPIPIGTGLPDLVVSMNEKKKTKASKSQKEKK